MYTNSTPRGGALNKCLYGETPPRGPTTYHFYTIFFFHEKGTPFVYLLLKNGAPFTNLVYNFTSLLTALSFK